MVEAAIVLPIILFLVMSLLELGVAFKNHLTVANTVRDATRTLTAKGDDPDADCATIERIIETMSGGTDPYDILKIEIYQAAADGSQINSKTNTYTFNGGDITDCTRWTGFILYPPADRQVVAGSTPLDIVGVRVVLDSGWLTGMPPYVGPYQIDRTTISRIEPEVFE